MAPKNQKTGFFPASAPSLKWLWLALILVGTLQFAFAQESVPLTGAGSGSAPAPTFQLLEPSVLPSSGGESITSFSVYARLFFISFLTVIIILAVLMFVWGGIEYMLSEALPGKFKGKERMLGAVTGLLLALFSYLILNTINPSLVNWNNNTLIQLENTSDRAGVGRFPPTLIP